MILLDAAPLIAFFTGDTGAAETHELIAGREPIAVTVVNLAEVFDVLNRIYGVSDAEMRTTVEPLIGDPLGVVSPTAEAGARAGALRARNYRRRTCELSLADCFLLAAVGPDDRLATSDEVVLRVARVEGLGALPIPTS